MLSTAFLSFNPAGVSCFLRKQNQSINQFIIINNHQRDVTKLAKRMLFKTEAYLYAYGI